MVIATPTTLALESILLGAKVVIDGTDDKVNRTTAAEALKRYTHLKDLKSIENLKIANNVDEMLEIIQENLSNQTKYTKPDISDILYFDQIGFGARLRQLGFEANGQSICP